jgi:hypothetical protein
MNLDDGERKAALGRGFVYVDHEVTKLQECLRGTS